jgi:hypothetical protein
VVVVQAADLLADQALQEAQLLSVTQDGAVLLAAAVVFGREDFPSAHLPAASARQADTICSEIRPMLATAEQFPVTEQPVPNLHGIQAAR